MPATATYKPHHTGVGSSTESVAEHFALKCLKENLEGIWQHYTAMKTNCAELEIPAPTLRDFQRLVRVLRFERHILVAGDFLEVRSGPKALRSRSFGGSDLSHFVREIDRSTSSHFDW